MLERISSSSVFGAFSIFLMWGDTEKQREFVIIFIKIYHERERRIGNLFEIKQIFFK